MSATTESTQISFYRPVSRSLPRLGVRYLRTHPAEGAALCWVLLLVLLAVVPELFAPAGFNTQNLRERLQGPSSAHWLGRDELGRDTLSRVIYGTRVSVVVGLLAARGLAGAPGGDDGERGVISAQQSGVSSGRHGARPRHWH